MTVPQSSLGSLASPLQGSYGYDSSPLGPQTLQGLGFASVADLASSSADAASSGGSLFTSIGSSLPVVGSFIALAGNLIGPILKMFKGCGQTCTQATQYANQAEDALKQLNQQYFAQPVRYASMQQHALQLIDQVFQALQQACSNPALGAAGQRCLSERLVKGGTAPWCPKPNHTGCDWITLYRDPIANDQSVQPDPEGSISGALSSLTSGSVAGIPTALLIGGALLVAALFMSGDGRR